MKHYAMKINRGAKVELFSFLMSVLDGSVCSASCLGPLYSWERSPALIK
jgi:hypothetical protein